ncbi:MAG: glutamine amidotransferase [Chloroflexota bacterium]
MTQPLKVLIAGESWETLSFHQKGFDVFTTTFYYEGVGPLQAALEAAGHDITYMPSHVAATKFPVDATELQAFDVVMLSDIGANTLLLHPDTFERSKRMPNRLKLINDYVSQGGGLIMVGGYLTFQGIDAKARYAGTPVEAALPVTMLTADDRAEVPEGATPQVKQDHPIVAGLDREWPALLGYNRLIARPEAVVVATAGDDPLLTAWAYGQGRAVAFASDCGPHWAPPEFLEWGGYASLWAGMVEWVGGAR